MAPRNVPNLEPASAEWDAPLLQESGGAFERFKKRAKRKEDTQIVKSLQMTSCV